MTERPPSFREELSVLREVIREAVRTQGVFGTGAAFIANNCYFASTRISRETRKRESQRRSRVTDAAKLVAKGLWAIGDKLNDVFEDRAPV